MPSIINSDDGVVSGTSGLKTTGGNDGLLNIQTNGSNAISISSGQRSTFPTTIGVGGATPSTSGSGITFPGTQSASTDANTLDDYEEGTWTPTLTGSVSGSTTSGMSGFYTKIGNLVYARIQVLNPDAATIGGSWRFSLPFTARSNEYMGGYVTYQRAIPAVASGTWLSGAVFSGTAIVGLIYNKNTTAESEGVSGNVPSNSMLMGMTIVYLIAT